MKTKIYKSNNMYYKMVNGKLVKLTPLERFIKFLKDEMVYERYRYNRLKRESFNVKYPKFMKNFNPEQLIIVAFLWMETNEGHSFWRNINSKWNHTRKIEGYNND